MARTGADSDGSVVLLLAAASGALVSVVGGLSCGLSKSLSSLIGSLMRFLSSSQLAFHSPAGRGAELPPAEPPPAGTDGDGEGEGAGGKSTAGGMEEEGEEGEEGEEETRFFQADHKFFKSRMGSKG